MSSPMPRAVRALSLFCSVLLGLAVAAPANAVNNLTVITGANGTGTQDANLTADGIIALADPDIGGNTLSIGALEAVPGNIPLTVSINGPVTVNDLGGNLIDLQTTPGQLAFFGAQNSGSIIFANPAADGFTTAGGALQLSAQGLVFGRASTNGGALNLGGGNGVSNGGPISTGAGMISVQAVSGPLDVNAPYTTTTGDIGLLAGSGSSQTFTNNSTITSTSGNIGLAGDRVVLSPGSSVTTGGAATVSVLASTIGTVIDVGTASDVGLGISAAELATISAGRLLLQSTAGINVTAPIVSPAPTLHLSGGGFITQSAGATITAANLLVVSGGAVTFVPGNSVGTLSTNTTGVLNYSDTDALTLNDLVGNIGVENDGPITIASGPAATMTVSSLVRAIPAGSVTLTPGTGLTITGTGDVTAGTGAFTQNGVVPVSTAGDVAATSVTFAGNVTLTGGVAFFANPGAVDFNGALGIGLTTSTMTGPAGVILGNPGTAFSVTANGVGATGVINANGPVATSDAALVVTSAGGIPGGTSLTIVNNDGADAVTGTFQGLPQGALVNGGAQSFVISYTGGTGNDIVLIAAAPPAITSANATTFTVGTAGTFTVTTTGTPAPTLSAMGALPAGVTFVDNGNGTATLSGTPAAGTGGTYPITITAANGIPPDATQSFTLTVNQPPAITSANNATFTVGTAGTFSVTTTGFPTSTLSAMGALPAGVTFVDNGNGTATLSGTPGAGTGGTYPLTITANNGVAPNATQSFTLTVNQAPAITSANATSFAVGTPGTFTVTSTGFPTPALSVMGALPAGVTFVDNGNGTGTLSGTPAPGSAGTYPLTFTAANGVAPDATQAFTLTVTSPPTITSANQTTFTVGAPGTFTVTTTGFPAPTITVMGTLPAGVTFVDNGNGTGTLSGTPAAGTEGFYNLTFTASNGTLPNAVQPFVLNVFDPAPIPTLDRHGLVLLLALVLGMALVALRRTHG